MHHIIFTEADTYPTALLIKSNSLNKDKLIKNYIEPIVNNGLSSNECIAFDLKYDEKGKCPAKLKNEYLKNLLPALKSLGVNTLFVCDSEYFKHLTKVGKADPHYGSILDCKIKGFEDLKVILAPNYQALFYNPNIQQKLDMSLNTLVKYRQGNYTELGSNIIHSEHYPEDYHAIAHWLDKLHQYPTLACDIETFSLKFWETGIGTVGFTWDEHNGIAFPVDLKIEENNNQVDFIKRIAIRQLLRNFFEDYKGKLIWHNANFDLKIIVNTLWMSDLLDEKGKLEGIEVMTKNFHDTKIITYLATNSTAGNKLGLKDIAHEFAGNWAESEINDITQIPKDKLLRYNLVDCLSTYYAFNKFYPRMLEDQQEKPYKEVMLSSVKVILQMELTGMPVNMKKVKVAKKILVDIINECKNILDTSSLISKFEKYYTDLAFEKDYQSRKGKAVNPDKIKYKDRDTFPTVKFNPGSPTQLTALLYDLVGLPVIDRTETKLPATGAKTLKKLIHKTKDTEVLEVLNTIIEFAQADKILGTFIKALEGSVLKSDGWYYLHGNFNIGGTVSGRLSSSGPNLQNLPSSGTKFAKIIKECFEAPPGKLFVGADFSSLEDRISALTTKDPQKLKVYTDGYDGHCLRAYAYFKEQMPDIVDTVDSINSIDTKYKQLRQDSKVPTFALTYNGTYIAIMDQTGMSEEAAKAIEYNYHELYKVSDDWVAAKVKQATIDGYVTVAFDLRVRTPILSQVVLNSSSTPYEAQAEARTAGNALGQSYGLLNNRAAIEFQERVLASEYATRILPCAHIHDAQYFIIDNDLDVVHWVNTNLIECMEWQELPEIQHDQVKLGGELDIFYPSWKDDITIPNKSTKQEILNLCKPI